MSLGSDLDAALAELSARIVATRADLSERIAALEHPAPPPVDPPVDPPLDPPVAPPTDPPIEPPVDPPIVPPVADLTTATDAAGRVWTLDTDDVTALGARVLADGVAFANWAWGASTQAVRGVAFRLIAGGVYVRQADGVWLAHDASGFVPTPTAADGGPVPIAQVAPAPSGGGGPVVVPSGPPVAVAMFPLPDPLPVPPPSTNTNPKLLRPSDITPVIDEATGEPWYADISLKPLTAAGEPIYDVLGYGASFKLRRIEGELRVAYGVGGGYGAPTSAREFSLAGVQHGRLNQIEFTNNWPEFSGRNVFSPGDFIAIGIDPTNPNRMWSSGSMDYTAVQTATVFERTVGPNGSVADLAAASFGRIQRNDRNQVTGIEGLNGKECMGGITRTPLWMQQAYGMGPLMLLGGQYTSLVAQAAAASMGLFAATFDHAQLRIPRGPDEIVPVTICADHRNGSRRDDWANPIDADGRPKQTFAPGTQPFDRGRCIGGFIRNWLDTSAGVAGASRSTFWKVDIEGDIATVISGPPWAVDDAGRPNMQMFDWWKNGFELWQHGAKTVIHPQSFVGVGEWGALNPAAFGGYDFIGTKQPVRFVEAIDETHIRMVHNDGTPTDLHLQGAWFLGPDVIDFFRQIGFDDRNQWDGVFPDGFGRWTWGTGYMQTPTLIAEDEDGDRKYGLVCLYNGGLGQVFYDHSTFQSDSRVCEWHIIDPRDLGKGAIGQLQPHMVQPAEIAFDPTLTDDCRRFGRTQGILPWGQWSSLDWDRETDELYVFGNLMAHAITGGQLRVRRYRVNRAVAA